MGNKVGKAIILENLFSITLFNLVAVQSAIDAYRKVTHRMEQSNLSTKLSSSYKIDKFQALLGRVQFEILFDLIIGKKESLQADKVFSVFVSSQNNVDAVSFMAVLIILSGISVEEKLKFLFDVANYHDVGTLTFTELQWILNTVPPALTKATEIGFTGLNDPCWDITEVATNAFAYLCKSPACDTLSKEDFIACAMSNTSVLSWLMFHTNIPVPPQGIKDLVAKATPRVSILDKEEEEIGKLTLKHVQTSPNQKTYEPRKWKHEAVLHRQLQYIAATKSMCSIADLCYNEKMQIAEEENKEEKLEEWGKSFNVDLKSKLERPDESFVPAGSLTISKILSFSGSRFLQYGFEDCLIYDAGINIVINKKVLSAKATVTDPDMQKSFSHHMDFITALAVHPLPASKIIASASYGRKADVLVWNYGTMSIVSVLSPLPARDSLVCCLSALEMATGCSAFTKGMKSVFNCNIS